MAITTIECVEKVLPPLKIAALRMRAPFQECGAGFGKLFRAFFWQQAGPPMMLCYDPCYQEIANYEVALPIKRGESRGGIEVRDLPGGRCLALLHRGSYDELRHSYARARNQATENGYQLALPSREVYLRGPGMIFRGKPKNYQTEIQLMIHDPTAS